MGEYLGKKISDILRQKSERRKWVRAIVSLSLAVLLVTNSLLALRGVAMSQDEHTHTDACYEETTTLVCGQEESDGHQHTDECYTRVRGELVCQDTSEDHVHTDDCYEWHDELTCAMEEGEGAHHHTEECYQTERTLVCGKVETRTAKGEEPGKDAEAAGAANAEAEEETGAEEVAEVPADQTPVAAEMPAQRFEAETKDHDLNIVVEADAGTFPAGTTMEIEEIAEDDEEVAKAVADTMEKDNRPEDEEVVAMKAVDIKFLNAEGEEIEPLLPVRVTMTSETIKQSENVVIVHLDDEDEEKNEIIKQKEEEELKKLEIEPAEDQVVFEAEKFSKYVLVGTELVTEVTLPGSNDTYEVSVTAPAAAKIPKGAYLEVSSIEEGSTKYQNAWDAAIGDDAEDVPEMGMAALDITIKDADGNPVEPEAPVQVSFVMNQIPDDVSEDDLANTATVLHLKGEGESVSVETVADTNWETSGIEVSGGTLEAQFNVSSFSTFVITWASSAAEPSEADSTTKLNLTTESGLTVQVNIHYVDQNGTRLNRPSGVSAVESGEAEYTITAENLAKAISGAELQGIYYGSRTGDEVTKIVATGTNGGTTTGPVKKGTAGNNGKPVNWTPDKDTIYYDANGNQIWYRKPSKDYRFFTTSSGGDKEYRFSGDVYARETTTAYNYTLTALYNTAETLTRAAGDQQVDYKEYTGTAETWENAAEIYIVYGKAGDTVTLHFVDDQGNPLSGIAFNGTTLGDTVTYRLADLFPSNDSTLDLIASFTKEGYTYSNTYIKEYNGIEGGTPVGNHLRRHNNIPQYRDRADSSSYTNLNNGDDVYCVYSPVPGNSGGGGGGGGSDTPPDLGEIGNKKEIENNEDGTYQVNLSVSGTAQNKKEETDINVIFVIDDSGSMYDNNRMEPTKTAVKNMADQLLQNNTGTNDDAVELALVSFGMEGWQATFGTDEAEWTTSYTDFAYQIDNWYYLKDQGSGVTRGTNWEAGLNAAMNVTNSDNNPTYVIFFTDGQPTQYLGQPNKSEYLNSNLCYWPSRDEARDLVNSGYVLYGIFAYGSDTHDYLGQLINYAYNKDNAKADYYFPASNAAGVESALKAILKEINMNFAYANVEIGDGITGLSTVTFESVDPESFNYTITYKDYTTYTEYTTKTANITVDKAANTITIPEGITYKVPDPDDPTKTNLLTKTTVATTIKGATYSNKQVTWDLEKSDGSIYMLLGDWTYAVDFKVWPSQRSYDLIAALNNRVIDWGEDFTYTDGDGVTHTVTFAEYESQINQGTPYSLKTNTSASVKYQQVTETIDDQGHSSYSYGDEKTVPITTSYNMRLDSTDMPVIKKFDDDINTHNPYTQVRFYLMVDDKYYQTDGTISDTLIAPESVAADGVHTWCMDLNSSNNWSEDVFISPGVITDHTEEGTRVVKVLETGHKYSLVEKNITGDEYEYEFTPQTLRPMVVNGTLKYLVKADTYNPAPTSGTTYTIDGDVYFEAPANAQALIGTNRKTGEIDITKVINDPNNLIPDGAEESETFTYAVTLNIPAGKDARGIMGYEFVARPNDAYNGTNRIYIYGYQEEVDDEGNLISTPFTPDSTRFVGLVYGRYNSQVYKTFEGLDSNTDRTVTVYLTLKQNEVIRFTNLPTGTTYSITEVAANVGKADDGSNYPAPITSFTVPAGGTPAEQGYTVSSKSSAGGTGGDTISGEITTLDTRYYHQFTNTVTSYENRVYAELKVKKVVEDYDWLSEYYRFTLAAGEAAYSDGTTGTSPMPSANQSGAYQVSIYNDTPDHTLSFGSIRYTQAGTYQYTLTEGTYFNYVDYADPVTITVTVEEQNGELVVTNIEDDAGTTVFTAATSTAQANGLTTQTNKLKTIDVSATKEWLKADGTTVLTDLPEGTTVTFTLCQGENYERTDQTIELNGEVDTNGESAAWVATWTGLPQYAVTTVTGDDGTQTRVATEIVYTVAEDIVPAGFEKITVDPVANGGKIQNKQLARDVNIQKRRQDGSTPLNGAIFDLYTKDGYESVPKAAPIKTNLTSEKVGDVDGVIRLGELTYGEYYLVETTAPAGYNKLTEAVKLTVNANGISILQGGTLRTDDKPEDTDYTAFITNDEGVELPAAGGPGTFLYTLSGLALVLGSALMYGFRMRRRERRLN